MFVQLVRLQLKEKRRHDIFGVDVCCADFPSNKKRFKKLQEVSRSKKLIIVPGKNLVFKKVFLDYPIILKAYPLFATRVRSN